MDHQLRILIADDDRHARAGIRAFLSTMLSCQIVGEASNGLEAIAQVERHQPNAVLIDLRMPVLDGVQASRVIKERWPQIAVIALTIYPEHHLAALGAGVDAVVSKGDAPILLIQTLQKMGPGSQSDLTAH